MLPKILMLVKLVKNFNLLDFFIVIFGIFYFNKNYKIEKKETIIPLKKNKDKDLLGDTNPFRSLFFFKKDKDKNKDKDIKKDILDKNTTFAAKSSESDIDDIDDIDPKPKRKIYKI
jgi:hypothetical protein